MHPMLFSVKRTHLCGVERMKPIAARFDLTPARFDMLRVIALYDWGLPQWKLVKLLGVSAAVVSRMLGQLTALGFVRRERDPFDRRRKIVYLEPDGADRVDRLLHEHEFNGDLVCIVCEVFAPPENWDLSALYKKLNRARRKLNDRAPFMHPWRVADIVDDRGRFLTIDDDDVDATIPREDELADREPEEVAEWTSCVRSSPYDYDVSQQPVQ